eukprot:2742452-Rhodomonas_salina.1
MLLDAIRARSLASFCIGSSTCNSPASVTPLPSSRNRTLISILSLYRRKSEPFSSARKEKSRVDNTNSTGQAQHHHHHSPAKADNAEITCSNSTVCVARDSAFRASGCVLSSPCR